MSRLAKRNYMYQTPAWDKFISSMDNFQSRINVDPSAVGPSSPVNAKPVENKSSTELVRNRGLFKQYLKSLGHEPSNEINKNTSAADLITIDNPDVYEESVGVMLGKLPIDPNSVVWGKCPTCKPTVLDMIDIQNGREGYPPDNRPLEFKNKEGQPICRECATGIPYEPGRIIETCQNCHKKVVLSNKSLSGKRICKNCYENTDGILPQRLDFKDRVYMAASKLMRQLED